MLCAFDTLLLWAKLVPNLAAMEIIMIITIELSEVIHVKYRCVIDSYAISQAWKVLNVC